MSFDKSFLDFDLPSLRLFGQLPANLELLL